jgi:hypothetical protein
MAAPFLYHWYEREPIPAAVTLNVAVAGAVTVWFCGWAVIDAACARMVTDKAHAQIAIAALRDDGRAGAAMVGDRIAILPTRSVEVPTAAYCTARRDIGSCKRSWGVRDIGVDESRGPFSVVLFLKYYIL